MTTPGIGIVPANTDDLQKLLTSLNLLGKVDGATGQDVLESTTTKITSLVAPAVTFLGGASAVGTAIAGFWGSIDSGVRITVIAGLSAVLVACAFSLAILVGNDLKSRAAGQVAIYQARNAITVAAISAAKEPVAAKEPNAARHAAGASTRKNSGDPTASEIAIIALAASAKSVRVTYAKGGAGTLNGIQTVGGEVTVGVLKDGGGQDWPAPADLFIGLEVYPEPVNGNRDS